MEHVEMAATGMVTSKMRTPLAVPSLLPRGSSRRTPTQCPPAHPPRPARHKINEGVGVRDERERQDGALRRGLGRTFELLQLAHEGHGAAARPGHDLAAGADRDADHCTTR